MQFLFLSHCLGDFSFPYTGSYVSGLLAPLPGLSLPPGSTEEIHDFRQVTEIVSGIAKILARLWGPIPFPLYTGQRNGRKFHPKTTRYIGDGINRFPLPGPRGETKSFKLSWDAKQARICEHYSPRNESLPQTGRDRMEVTPRAPPIS